MESLSHSRSANEKSFEMMKSIGEIDLSSIINGDSGRKYFKNLKFCLEILELVKQSYLSKNSAMSLNSE